MSISNLPTAESELVASTSTLYQEARASGLRAERMSTNRRTPAYFVFILGGRLDLSL